MNKFPAALAVFLCSLAVCLFMEQSAAAPSVTPQQEYIAKYSRIAVEEMYRSGVPASITLAQGLLESGCGRSELAVKANNHFGIKCHDWKGPSMRFDDDRKRECFRKYEHAEASFKDHSDFLRYRDRYKFLFELNTTDYKGWAYGLKKAGYATDPKYSEKLIKLIEDYELSRFDTASSDDFAGPASELSDRKTGSAGTNKASGEKKRRKRDRVRDKSGMKTSVSASKQIPDSPAFLEAPVPLEKDRAEKFSYSLSRRLYSQNNVPFVYSVAGETYSVIAKKYDLFLSEILKYNDVHSDKELASGTVVYLQAKKKKAARHVDKFIADGGESLWSISQRFGIRMSALEKLNGLAPSYIAKPEDTIRLR